MTKMSESNQDKLLADRVVALGIGSKHFGLYSPIHVNSTIGTMVGPSLFLSDWRVAGACFEALDRTVHDMISLIQSAVLIEQRERNWPRAIIEACVEELERV